MIPPVLFHGAKAARMVARKSAPDDGGHAASYAARFGILMAVLAVLGAILGIAWESTSPGRRAPARVIEEGAIEPLVRDALADVGASGDAEVRTARAETRFWKRRYDELSAVATVRIAPEQVGPFLRAVGDSLQGRLIAARAKPRGVTASGWPDSLSPARPSGPARLSLPYATRKRVGWLTLDAVEGGAGLTLLVTIHEGPKPSD